MEHFRQPRNVGEIDRPDAEARVQSPVHGDNLRLTFALKGDRISRVRFQCSGCAVAIASGSVATTLLAGRTVDEALALTDEDVQRALGGVLEHKQRCSLVVRDAVQLALGDRKT